MRSMTPRVLEYVADAATLLDVTVDQVMSKSRKAPLPEVRGIVMARLRDGGFTTTQIGAWFGLNHATVIHWTTPGYRARRSRRNSCGRAIDRLNGQGA
jgi:chromosomal replication initiation ATPase DnaA